jgi:hypothetical protein
MTRYERNPIIVEAHVWNGFDGVFEVIEEMVSPMPVDRQSNDGLAIHAGMLGTKVAAIGDMVCKGDDGNIFTMDVATFNSLYHEVEAEEGEDDEVRLD